MSTNSIIEYIVDRLLEAEGLTEADIVKEDAEKKIRCGWSCCRAGVSAACLPEPLASSTVSGAVVESTTGHIPNTHRAS